MERIYQPDQDILDARGIELTVSEVVGLSTSEYAARLRRLALSPHDAAFVKSLRRRIKNRVASHNSRRRTADHLRTLSAELRALRASKVDTIERHFRLSARRDQLEQRLALLTSYIRQKLEERGDPTPLPASCEPAVRGEMSPGGDRFECRLDNLVAKSVHHIYRYDKRRNPTEDAILNSRKYSIEKDTEEKDIKDIDIVKPKIKSDTAMKEPCETFITDASIEENIQNEREEVAKTLQLLSTYRDKTDKVRDPKPSPEGVPKIVRAKCVAVAEDCTDYSLSKRKLNVSEIIKNFNRDRNVNGSNGEDSVLRCNRLIKKRSCIMHTSEFEYETCFSNTNVYLCAGGAARGEVLNLSLRPSAERRHHGRKQLTPRRITHALADDDAALDLKIKKDLDPSGQT